MKKTFIISSLIATVFALTFLFTGCNDTAETESASAGTIPAFETQDIEGNTVSSDIFADKDITVLNVWGTFCGPCIDEMPELAAWDAELPDNAQIIGLVADVPDNSKSAEAAAVIRDAKDIVRKTGVKYTNIIPSPEFAEFLNSVTGVPTTFFVNSKGEIVGDPILGADVNAYKERLQ